MGVLRALFLPKCWSWTSNGSTTTWAATAVRVAVLWTSHARASAVQTSTSLTSARWKARTGLVRMAVQVGDGRMPYQELIETFDHGDGAFPRSTAGSFTRRTARCTCRST